MSLGDYLGSTLSRVYAEVGAQLQEAESALRGGLRNAAAKATDPLSPDEGRPDCPHHPTECPSSTSSSSLPTGSVDRSVTSSPGSGNAMSCDNCEMKFTIFNRKKQCRECSRMFCANCCSRDAQLRSRYCGSCRILLKRPLTRAELMDLRIKDLQRFLGAKGINTKSCVEKKDLVELILRETGGVGAASESGGGGAGAGVVGSRRDPIERQRSFPKSYTESTHRAEWLAKFDSDKRDAVDEEEPSSESDLVKDFVVVPSTSSSASSSATSPTLSSPHNSSSRSTSENRSHRQQEQQLAEGLTEEATEVTRFSPPPPDPPGKRQREANSGAGLESYPSADPASQPRNGATRPVASASAVSDTPSAGLTAASRTLDRDLGSSMSSPTSSPHKFASRGLVYLSDIECEEDLNELSSKQMKDILAMNRVHFKGVVEKSELHKIVLRVWREEKKLMEDKDMMEDSDLCKVCMDLPVDCVMLECGHMCTCIKCGKQMNECPICRQYVVRVVKTFRS